MSYKRVTNLSGVSHRALSWSFVMSKALVKRDCVGTLQYNCKAYVLVTNTDFDDWLDLTNHQVLSRRAMK